MYYQPPKKYLVFVAIYNQKSSFLFMAYLCLVRSIKQLFIKTPMLFHSERSRFTRIPHYKEITNINQCINITSFPHEILAACVLANETLLHSVTRFLFVEKMSFMVVRINLKISIINRRLKSLSRYDR